jgi:hypothetical protein
MSTPAIIATLEAAGKLTRYDRPNRRPARRRLYLTQDALKDLTDRSSAVNLLVGRGFIEAALTRWVTGGLVYGDRRGGRFLRRLLPPPPEIWEIRVTDPIVQARLLGRFAEPDTLILFKFYTRALLGERNSAAWRNAMRTCEKSWQDLFGSVTPFSGTTIHDYITENCDDFPL